LLLPPQFKFLKLSLITEITEKLFSKPQNILEDVQVWQNELGLALAYSIPFLVAQTTEKFNKNVF